VKALAEVYSSAPATRSLSHGPSTDALWRTTTKDLPQMPPSLPRTSSTCQTAPFRDAQGSLDRYDVRRDQAISGLASGPEIDASFRRAVMAAEDSSDAVSRPDLGKSY
jgi:hypothetical protein